MKKKGFTLIELMIVLSIFSIVSVYIYQVFFSQIKQSFRFTNNLDVQHNINKAMSMITDEIRNYSFTNITVQSVDKSKVFSEGKLIIDLTSNTSNADINYNSETKVLIDNQGRQCTNIESITIEKGIQSNDEDELILINISCLKGEQKITSYTAINIKK